MARIRSVKPELRRDLTVAEWPRENRYAWVLLWGYLDDEGRGLDDLRLLVADLFPLDHDVTAKKLDAWLARMAGASQHTDLPPLCRYEVDGRRYLHATKWIRSQRVSHPYPSRIPPCPIHEDGGNQTGANRDPLATHSGAAPESFPPSRTRADQVKDQGSGIAPQEGAPEVTPLRQRDELFDTLAAVCEIDPSSLTKSGRGQINAALGQLRAVEATPAQITLRARRYRERFADAALTPSALVKHWAGLNGISRADDPIGWAR